MGRHLRVLTSSFVPSKPLDHVSDAIKQAGCRAGQLQIQRKRDGQRMLVLVNCDGDVHLYSRRMESLTTHFPSLVDAIRAMDLPTNSVLDGELLVIRDGDRDDFRAVSTMTKALPAKARARAAIEPIAYHLFDVLVMAGHDVWRLPYRQRVALVMDVVRRSASRLVIAPHILRVSLSKARQLVTRHNWEGLVLWQLDAPTVVSHAGKPRAGCIKDKPPREGDFLAVGYELGTGSFSRVVGSLVLETVMAGRRVPVGRVGSGLDTQTRTEALTWRYPCVVTVKYDKMEPDTHHLRFPTFLRKHEDKTPEEV